MIPLLPDQSPPTLSHKLRRLQYLLPLGMDIAHEHGDSLVPGHRHTGPHISDGIGNVGRGPVTNGVRTDMAHTCKFEQPGCAQASYAMDRSHGRFHGVLSEEQIAKRRAQPELRNPRGSNKEFGKFAKR